VTNHPAGGTNHDIGTAGQSLFFGGKIGPVASTINSNGADGSEIGKSFQILSDLYG
jgi:hypothetical protein